MSFTKTQPILCSAIVLALLLPLTSCSEHKENKAASTRRGDERRQPVEVVKLLQQDLAETLVVVGSLAPNESADIRPEIAGLVKGIYFEEGMAVKTGQVLVKIDDAELRAQVAQTEARFHLAELNLERAENLRKTQSNTQADVDRSRSEHSSAKAELALLRLRLEKTEVKAPFDGIVGSRTISVGDYVNTQTSITTIDDLSRLKVDFQVPERALAKIAKGTRFNVTSSSLERDGGINVISGEIYFVSSIIERTTRSSQAKGILVNPPTRLKPGMFANIEVVLDVRKNTLTAPEGAVLTTASGASLIVVKPAGENFVADFVPVRLGLRARGLVEVEAVTGKLTKDLSIVASGVGGLILYPGAKVIPKAPKDSLHIQSPDARP